MSSAVYDAIVVGMGIHGSSSLAHLAMKGASVLGIEQFSNSPSHNMGSSHGESRIIRKAYFEDPAYVPLLERAFGLWQELELLTNNKLLYMTGGLMIGKPDSEVISGTLTSAKEHALRHTVFTADEIRSRFPSFSPSEGEIGVFENEAGYLLAEACVSCYQTLARANGALIEFNLKMNGYEVIENEASKEPLIRVFTNKGIYTTKKLILAVGSWASKVYGEDLLSSEIELTVERRVSFWIQPKEEDIEVFRSLPIYIWDSNSRDPESYSFYGFPLLAGKESEGAKIALHFPSSTAPSDSAETPTICTPGNLLREVTAKDEQLLRKAIRSRLPSLDGTILRTSVCSYTVTKNHHFLIDFSPSSKNVILVSPCSGHGFKFGSVIGEIVADLALTGRSSFDLSLFSISSHSGLVNSSSSPKSPYPAVVAQDVLRADNDDTGIVYYFAIGSMMNKTSMKLRNLIPLSSEPGEILDYEIGFFGSGGFAEAKPSPGKSFHGVLHRMTTAQMEGLDRIECLYARAYANVRLYDGQVRQNCCVYQSNLLLNCSSQPPTQRYLELLIQGAEEHGVLSSYIDYLKTIPFIPRPLPHEFLALEVPSVVENTPHWTEEQLQEGDGVQDNPFYFAVNGKVVQYTGVRDESSYFFRISCAVALPGKHYEPAVSKNVYDPKYGPVKDLEDFTEEHCRYLEDMFVRNFMLHESSDSACLVVVARIKQFYRPDNPPLPSPSAVKCNAALTCDRQ